MPEQQLPSTPGPEIAPDPLPRTCIPQGPGAVPSPSPWGSRAASLVVIRYLPPGQSPDSCRRQGQGQARVRAVRPRCQPEPQEAAEPPFVSAESRDMALPAPDVPGAVPAWTPRPRPRPAAGLGALSRATFWASRAVPCRRRAATDFRPLERPR